MNHLVWSLLFFSLDQKDSTYTSSFLMILFSLDNRGPISNIVQMEIRGFMAKNSLNFRLAFFCPLLPKHSQRQCKWIDMLQNLRAILNQIAVIVKELLIFNRLFIWFFLIAFKQFSSGLVKVNEGIGICVLKLLVSHIDRILVFANLYLEEELLFAVDPFLPNAECLQHFDLARFGHFIECLIFKL